MCRYQTRNGNDGATDLTRSGLEQIVDRHYSGADRAIWKVLVRSYSGLSDLSVPAWILAGSLVRPGGRLALVAPATWRSRNYADVIRYMLLRFFALETIVTDSQPGWFSDAQVRTHLIIARRLSASQARQRLSRRERWPEAQWLHVGQQAADKRSLVGSAFKGEHPEADFAASVYAQVADAARGIEVKAFDLRHEWATLDARLRRQRWYPTLEGGGASLSLFFSSQKPAPPALPEALRDMLPPSADTTALTSLAKAGIRVGQGLRTGCNAFFYVTACSTAGDTNVQVKASPALGGMEFSVPSDALHPVLRRQAEMQIVERGRIPPGRILDLRAWVLPEDSPIVANSRPAYQQHRTNPPRVMPTALAAFVRQAATMSVDRSAHNKLIPELSAVRTNVRRPNSEGVMPRFWYMLPDYAPRSPAGSFCPTGESQNALDRMQHGSTVADRCQLLDLLDARRRLDALCPQGFAQ